MTQIEQKTANAAAEATRMGVLLSEEKQPALSNRGALANTNPDAILARINQGASLRQLADELGVSNVGLRAWLLRENGEQYNEAITNALTLRVAEADDALEAADDVVSIARAREQARFARMDFERRRPALYGQRQQITHDIGPDLGDLLRDARKRVSNAPQVIDVTPSIDPPAIELDT